MPTLSFVRRAAAVAVLAFYVWFFGTYASYAPPVVSKALWAIAALYGVGVLGLVFGWFWGRWYARGLGYWGIVVGVLMMWQLGLENFLLVWAGSNAAVALLLAGESMAIAFDGREDWRRRFHLDENGVERLGKSVTRVGMSLPWLLLYLFLPRPADAAMMLPLVLAGAGVVGLLRARTWGLLALGGASVATTAQLAVAPGPASVEGVLAAVLLAAAVVPFARPIFQRLRA
ncbi:MAG: hypothetical protein F9K40_21175 [Kofleriaceae bacterium]|nr:MAG: hypothetical protein F9K40_21175 [Kofleriaceae bacterium]MBZ0237373.1 hypothetical protein [Kofleriaceae bacterium]